MLFRSHHVNRRFGIAAATVRACATERAALLDVVEEREELIELALRDGVVFVVVAAAAVEGQPEPRRAGCLDAVDDRLNAPLLRDESALAVDPVVAIEAGGNELALRRLRCQVASPECFLHLLAVQTAADLVFLA